MRKNPPKTPLLAALRSLTPAQRVAFAKDAGTTVGYLYQLAGCYRGRCTDDVARRIASASVRLSTHHRLTAEQVQRMCMRCGS